MSHDRGAGTSSYCEGLATSHPQQPPAECKRNTLLMTSEFTQSHVVSSAKQPMFSKEAIVCSVERVPDRLIATSENTSCEHEVSSSSVCTASYCQSNVTTFSVVVTEWTFGRACMGCAFVDVGKERDDLKIRVYMTCDMKV